MTATRSDFAGKLLSEILPDALAARRADRPTAKRAEEAIRVLVRYETELRTARAGLQRLVAGDGPTDPFSVDVEESPEALRRRVDEYRDRRDGFLKAVAVLFGHDEAVRLDAEARRR